MAFAGIFIIMIVGVIVALYIRYITRYAIFLIILSIIGTAGFGLILAGIVRNGKNKKALLITGTALALLSTVLVVGGLIRFALYGS
jgi:hypothetical protein